MQIKLKNAEFTPISIEVVIEEKGEIAIIEALLELVDIGINELHEKNRCGIISQSLGLKYSLAAEVARDIKKKIC